MVLVCNYLWRPTARELLATVKPGGLLLYETFMAGNEMYGKPSRPEFLLRPNELAQWVYGDFRVIAFDQMPERGADGKPVAMKQRIAAIRNLPEVEGGSPPAAPEPGQSAIPLNRSNLAARARSTRSLPARTARQQPVGVGLITDAKKLRVVVAMHADAPDVARQLRQRHAAAPHHRIDEHAFHHAA